MGERSEHTYFCDEIDILFLPSRLLPSRLKGVKVVKVERRDKRMKLNKERHDVVYANRSNHQACLSGWNRSGKTPCKGAFFIYQSKNYLLFLPSRLLTSRLKGVKLAKVERREKRMFSVNFQP